MSEFTKGPWTVHKNGRIVLAGGIRIYQSTGPGGAQSVQVQQRLDAELRANSNLLAAAPELYEAAMESFKAILDLAMFGHLSEKRVKDLIEELRCALDKADGKQPQD